MLKAISPHLDKVNVCFAFVNGGVVMGPSGRPLWGLMVCRGDVKTRLCVCVFVEAVQQREEQQDKIR